MHLKTYSLIALIAVSFSSCSSLKKHIQTQKIIDQKLENFHYEMSLAKLKEALDKYFTNFPTMQSGHKQTQKLRDSLDKGFTYKGKFFASRSIDGSDLFAAALVKEKKKAFMDLFTKDSYFTLEEGPKSFLILEGNHIYQGQAVGTQKSKLTIYKFLKIHRGPLALNMNLIRLLTGSGLFSIAKGTIILDKSITDMKRSSNLEWRALKGLNKNLAEKIQLEARNEYAQGARL